MEPDGSDARQRIMNLRLPVLLGTLLLITSCGSLPTPGGGVGPDLDGRAFVSTGVTVDGADRPLVPGSLIRMTFADGRLSMNANCNTMSDQVQFDGNRMKLAGALATTEMGCPESLMSQDRWLADQLTTGGDLTVRGDVLTFVSAGTTITLQDSRTATPDAPLVMTEWVLDTIVEGDVASNVPAGVTANLSFGSGLPRAFVQTGCNAGSGDVEVGPSTLVFGALELTQRACLDPASMAVETAIVAVLQGDVAYVVAGGTLTLTNGDRSLSWRAT